MSLKISDLILEIGEMLDNLKKIEVLEQELIEKNYTLEKEVQLIECLDQTAKKLNYKSYLDFKKNIGFKS